MLIRWTEPAVDDLTHISDYTEEHFGAAQARRVALAIYQGADGLQKMPYRGRAGRRPGTRELKAMSALFAKFCSGDPSNQRLIGEAVTIRGVGTNHFVDNVISSVKLIGRIPQRAKPPQRGPFEYANKKNGHVFNFQTEVCEKCGMALNYYADNDKPPCKGKKGAAQ